VLYLYAITEARDAPHRRGLRGASLRAIGETGLFATVSEHDDSRIEASEDDLWAHEAVVEALMQAPAVLPMRFGSSAADEPAVRALLRERRSEFTAALDRVRDKEELGVRAVFHEPQQAQPTAVSAAGPGTVYMLSRLEQERRSAATATRIHEPLAAIARESTRRTGSPSAGVLNAAYLVDRDMIDAFRTRVEELAEDVDEAALVCTGPWPPYSFTSAEAES
jgi:hypothetical protein